MWLQKSEIFYSFLGFWCPVAPLHSKSYRLKFCMMVRYVPVWMSRISQWTDKLLVCLNTVGVRTRYYANIKINSRKNRFSWNSLKNECFVYTLHSFNSSCASQMRLVYLTLMAISDVQLSIHLKADMTHCLHKVLNILGKPKQLKSHSIIKRKDWIHTIIVRACFWKYCLNCARSCVIAYSKSQIIKECSGISTSSVDRDIVDYHRKLKSKNKKKV